MLILGKPKTLGFMRTEVCEAIDHIGHMQTGIPMGLSQAEAGLVCQKSNHSTGKESIMGPVDGRAHNVDYYCFQDFSQRGEGTLGGA